MVSMCSKFNQSTTLFFPLLRMDRGATFYLYKVPEARVKRFNDLELSETPVKVFWLHIFRFDHVQPKYVHNITFDPCIIL